MRNIETERFKKIFNKYTNSKKINEGILLIESRDGEFSFCKGYGGKGIHSPLLMASITKLFTTACIIRLLEEQKLNLDDKISKYFDQHLLSGIHVYRGKDYSSELLISDLLFQTSGLPDVYFEGKGSLRNRVIQEDFYITFSGMLDLVKNAKPRFVPRKKGKAYYADINFDILGEIIIKVSGLKLSEAYRKYIFEPLGLSHTYLPEDENDAGIPPIYYMNQVIHRPKLVISSGASGGCISTARELMIFIKAFFSGTLFNKNIFDSLAIYNKLQFTMGPICYGGGYMQISLNGVSSLFMGKGELIGHSGSTGSFAFYYPMNDLFFVGDVSQMANPSLPIRMAMQLAIASAKATIP